MCNIAGYAGNKQAAPILMEMLKRQQAYDGDMSTGIATIHEGKLYYRKMVCNVETFIKETDVLDLPGTIGIAHTRPGGGKYAPHPALSPDNELAIVTNGTSPITKHSHLWSEAVDLLDQAGYAFNPIAAGRPQEHPRRSRDGQFVNVGECRALLIDYYLKQGKPITKALALACEHMYSDNITVMIKQNFPDKIFALRTTRPMHVVLENGEMYMATTRFGFPETLKNKPTMLPLHHSCIMSRDGITVTQDKMELEPVSEMTPYTYAEAYKRFEELLRSDKAPLFFDQLEEAADNMRDLWQGDHTCVQHARLVYDMLWQFEQEGRLSREERIQTRGDGQRRRWYFSLDK